MECYSYLSFSVDLQMPLRRWKIRTRREDGVLGWR